MAPGFRALPLPLAQLSLAAVLKCGQSFRWSIHPLALSPTPLDPSTPTHEYRLCLRDRVVCLRQTPDTLYWKHVLPGAAADAAAEKEKEVETLAWLRDYFQLDVDLLDLYNDWSVRDPVFARLRERFEGIRMLRQDPWENLVSFICSSNNNIARITKMVKGLCMHFSEPLITLPLPVPSSVQGPPTPGPSLPEVSPQTETFYPFPPPSRLASPDATAAMRSLGFGYRADYIQKTARMLHEAHESTASNSSHTREPAELWLETLRTLPTDAARTELLQFMGVGRKVADCVLLMSLDKREVIPVDTHVHQIAIKHYGAKGSLAAKQALSPKMYDEIAARLVGVWGEYAGWAHSVLFTADLKSFASYGLATPSPTPMRIARTKSAVIVDEQADVLPTPPLPPTAETVKKRKRMQSTVSSKVAEEMVVDTAVATLDGGVSLADRVKRRRRTVSAMTRGLG
ncbi:DNA glycosylase [Peniophora sp. CONT]|nr:DNA glycosylase [Peniophora sp. CONT]